MKPGQGSRTAEAAAALRASHTLYASPTVFEDPYACALTSSRWRRLLGSRWLHTLLMRGPLRPLSSVTAQVIGRSRYTEDLLEAARARGVRQYVLIGAGLDSFALRRRDLEKHLRVFEVDHADTQRWKRERLSALAGTLPENLEFVAADFERESLADALRRSRFDPAAPAFFSWLGVTHYLTPAATLATLRALAAFAAAGSELVFDYSLPQTMIPRREARAARRLARYTASRGEPMIGRFIPAQLHDGLSHMGFDVLEDLSGEAQTRRWFAGRRDGLRPTPATHFLHARLKKL